MSIRVSDEAPEGNPGNPSRNRPVTRSSDDEQGGRGLLSARSAAILGASLLTALIAGVLTYLALGRTVPGMAGAILAAGTTFAGTIRLLITIIA